MKGIQTLQLTDSLIPKGRIIVRRHPAGTLDKYEALAAEGRLAEAQALIQAGEIAVDTPNLIVIGPNCGKDLLVQWLISGFTSTLAFPFGPDFGDIGTGQTAPASGDTQLTAAVVRSAVTYATDNALTTAVLQFFYPDNTLPNQTYYEFGTFVGGSSTISTGQMFNHALFATPFVKTAGTDTTVEVDITLT